MATELVAEIEERPGSLVAGGPFHALLARLGGCDPQGLPTLAAALLLTLIAWVPLALLASFAGDDVLDLRGRGFFGDPTVHARFLVAIFVILVTERYADEKLRVLAHQFFDAQLVSRSRWPEFRQALERARRHTTAPLAEGMLIALAYAGAVWSVHHTVMLKQNGWEGDVVADAVELSAAGWWCALVSLPLMYFLILRWIWRFIVWARLLGRVARSDLQLVPTHPDGAAGLGFLGMYPTVFCGFVLACSVVMAVAFMREAEFGGLSSLELKFAMGAWIVFVFVIFVGPLVVFVAPLWRARDAALLAYGRLACEHSVAFRRKWITTRRDGADLAESGEVSAIADMRAVVQPIQSMHLMPLTRFTTVLLLLAAGLPMLVALATLMPLNEFLRAVAGAFL